ncbi:hypothetical protein HNQ91_002991 [Filimonas zeae]|uniref:Uncharacterized protein n=1 Tax=Filimonas zeae TaxID=1737353 RepID=A0A917IZX6_9BACT|nr:hypothetical protein [Filimonas zeae]MDR6339926.1 hypothetical protein [Filimonas zeae]GGH70324.1 hypothetical protein GCM10011379_28480 [Filimonas zeae]
MAQELTPTEQWLFTELNNFADRYFEQENRTGAFVTKSILGLIADYGDRQGYDVCVGGFADRYEKGWLFDLVWYKEDERRNLKSIELALEVEQAYGIKHIKYDFEKLLVSNAKINCMICLAGNLPIQEVITYFEMAVAAYEGLRLGSRFFILIWDDYNDGSFIHHIIEKSNFKAI